jgi:Reverse transcriptase-like
MAQLKKRCTFFTARYDILATYFYHHHADLFNVPCFQGDSQLILYQVEGKYKVKNENLKTLHTEATELLRSIPKYILEYIPRARNARADELSNFAMDTLQNTSTLVAGTTAASPSNILSDSISITLLGNSPSNIETAVESLSVPISETEAPELVRGGCGEHDGEDDADHIEGEGDIHLEGTVRITVPETDIVRNDDQTVTVKIAISQLKSLLAMDASEDVSTFTEKNSNSIETTAARIEENRLEATPKVRKTASRKVSDPLLKKAAKKVTVKKADKESITLSVQSPSEKTKKAPKTENKKIEISL